MTTSKCVWKAESLLSLCSGLSHPLLNARQGFDEYMNVVMDDTSEVYVKGGRPSLPLGLSCLHACTPPHNAIMQGESFSRETILRSFNPSDLANCSSGTMVYSEHNPFDCDLLRVRF
jgi:small nuclear ribonucleoprotein (snRNP)-like protein